MFPKAICGGCLFSIAVACLRVRPLDQVHARWPDQQYRPGYDSGWGREIMSSKSRHVCNRINILGSQLSPSSINLVPAQTGKVTIGLASHWPRGTDSSGITTEGLMALGREMSTPPKLQ